MKRIQINRRGKTDTRDSLSPMLAYIRLAFMWVAIVAIDAVTGFRIELIWPFWLIIRAAYESVHQKNQQSVASLTNPNTARFSVLFVCVTATSDLICYLFIPVRLLIFIATTYVWINLIWHTHGGFVRTMNTIANGDRSQSWLIVLLSVFVIAFEIVLRARCEYIYLNKDQQISYLIPSAVVPVVPRSFNAFFGAHCIGYPLILITFSLRYYFSEWKMRRKQGDVSYKNEQLYRILVESLPADYEGPKDYTSSCMDDECYLIEATTTQPMAITGPCHNGMTTPTTSAMVAATGSAASVTRKNGYKNRDGTTTPLSSSTPTSTTVAKRGGAKKNGGAAGAHSSETPPIEKKMTKRGSGGGGSEKHQMDENDESDGEGGYVWRADSHQMDEQRGGGISLIRFMFDVTAWILSLIGVGRSTSSKSSPSSSPMSSSAEAANKKMMRSADKQPNKQREYDRRVEVDEEMEEEMEKQLRMSETKSRSSTMLSNSSNSRTTMSNNNKRSNGKQLKPPHHDKNGHRMMTSSSSIRDSSHDTNASNDAELRTMSREIDGLRAELNTKKNCEEDAKLQIRMLEANESRLNQQISHLKMRIDQLENKCSSLEKHRESDKAHIEQSEQKYSTLMTRKTELEQALIQERKQRNDDTGKKMDLSEHQREKERQLEMEVDRLRVDLRLKEDSNRKMEVELGGLKNYKEENDIDAINMELRIHKDKSQHLESSLVSENKLKQELFRALGDAKANNKALERKITELEMELRNRPMIAESMDETTNSEHGSCHQMVSPASAKTPLSISIANRSSPFNADKLSPIGSTTGPLSTGGVAASGSPPDYAIACNQPKMVSNGFAYRYNQFQTRPSTGEHLLFDAPLTASSMTSSSTTSPAPSNAPAPPPLGPVGLPPTPGKYCGTTTTTTPRKN